MSVSKLSRFSLLPELELLKVERRSHRHIGFVCRKTSDFEVCPNCASKCYGTHDKRRVIITDEPLRGRRVSLEIIKRRFRCLCCTKVFMEPVSGISKGKRFTQRFKRHLLWCCERFTDLKAVKRHVGCSYGFLYSALYEQLELNRRKHLHPWPKVIGIDEHSFRKSKKHARMDFVTMIVDHRNRRVIDLVNGTSKADLRSSTAHMSARENVSWVTMDLSPTFRSFAKESFPNARIVADKFHVVRLLDNQINRKRKEITGDRRKLAIRKLLLKNAHDLDFATRSLILKWLDQYPELRDLYTYKQAIHKLYRTKGYNKARRAFIRMTDSMAHCRTPEIRSLRRTLLSWSAEILNYFRTGLTNARVEGFNNKAKLIKRRAYGYRSFKNYRLRVLNACC